MRAVGVEEVLLVVDPTGRPVPLGPEALEIAARRGEGETPEEHHREDAAEGHEESAPAPRARALRTDRRPDSSPHRHPGVEALLHRGTGSDLQRRVHRETGGDLGAVVRAAVAVTAGEPEDTAQAFPSRTD